MTVPAGLGREYYVDATSGNDANDGLTQLSPWQTINKINGHTFDPGSKIHFKRGETWTGTRLVVPASNLYFGVYGAGGKPIIDGNDTVDCIVTNGKSNLIFEDLDVTQGLDFGIAVGAVDNIKIINCDVHDCGNDNIIYNGSTNGLISGGSSYNAYTRTNDDRLISAIELKDGAHDITISGVEIYGCDASAFAAHYGTGIAVHSHAEYTVPYNITIDSCNIHDQGTRCYGIRINNANTAAMTDRAIVISNNTIEDGAYGGILINSTAGTSYLLNGISIENNIIAFNTNRLQLAIQNSNNITVKNNLLINNNNAQMGQNLAITDTTNINIYNNTLYSLFDNFWSSVYIDGAFCSNVVLKNNIIGGAIASLYCILVTATAGTAGMVIDYNLYQYAGAGNRWAWGGVSMNYATWLTNNSNDANSPTRGDPLFADPPTNDFTLQAGSPAINAGVDVGLSYLGVAPDCGAYEKE